MKIFRTFFSLFFLVTSFVILLSLFSYNCDDSAYRVINQESPKNILGYFGSYISDILLMLFGSLSYVVGVFFLLFSIFFSYKKNLFIIFFIFQVTILCALFIPKFGGFRFAFQESEGYYFLFITSSMFVITLYMLCQPLKKIFTILFFNKKATLRSFYDIPRSKVKLTISLISSKDSIGSLNIDIKQQLNSQVLQKNLLRNSNYYYLQTESIQIDDIIKTFEQFGIYGELKNIKEYSSFIIINFELNKEINPNRVLNVTKDMSICLKATSIRCVAEGHSLQIEITKSLKKIPYLKDILKADSKEHIPLILGIDTEDKIVIGDFSEVGSLGIIGKNTNEISNCLVSILLSIFFFKTLSECKIILMDFKNLDIDIPCLIKTKEQSQMENIFKWIDSEVEKRKNALFQLNTKTVLSFNQKLTNIEERLIRKKIQIGFDQTTGLPSFEEKIFDFSPFPLLLVVINGYENAIPKNINLKDYGIYFICTTSKSDLSNFAWKMCFSTNRIASLSNIDCVDAENLIGNGDMLLKTKNGSIRRIQTPIVPEEERKIIIEYLKTYLV